MPPTHLDGVYELPGLPERAPPPPDGAAQRLERLRLDDAAQLPQSRQQRRDLGGAHAVHQGGDAQHDLLVFTGEAVVVAVGVVVVVHRVGAAVEGVRGGGERQGGQQQKLDGGETSTKRMRKVFYTPPTVYLLMST